MGQSNDKSEQNKMMRINITVGSSS